MNTLDKIKARQEANLLIIQALTALVEANPDQRFSQILCNYGLVKHNSAVYHEGNIASLPYWEDEFYLESTDLLDRLNNTLEERK